MHRKCPGKPKIHDVHELKNKTKQFYNNFAKKKEKMMKTKNTLAGGSMTQVFTSEIG